MLIQYKTINISNLRIALKHLGNCPMSITGRSNDSYVMVHMYDGQDLDLPASRRKKGEEMFLYVEGLRQSCTVWSCLKKFPQTKKRYFSDESDARVSLTLCKLGRLICLLGFSAAVSNFQFGSSSERLHP